MPETRHDGTCEAESSERNGIRLRRLARITGYGLLTVLAVLLVAAAAAHIRLAQGPVQLDFLRQTVENRINANLPAMAVSVGGVVVERTGGSNVPQVRLRDIELKDKSGNLVARAPRAGVEVDGGALLSGNVVPVSIELIGPRIRVMRNLDGGMALGFGEAAPEGEAVVVDPETETSPKSDQDPALAGGGTGGTAGAGAAIIEILSGAPRAEGGQAIGSIETIRVAGAEIRFYDEANDAIWNIPSAELVFQRMPYGFAIAATADVANGREAGHWSADLSASYRRDTRSFSISTRINDLVPANISDEIFALSQLARVKVPLSGQVEMEVTDQGLVTRATGEFIAAAGEVGLPDYLAEPLIIDEGSLRADYDPVTGSIVITDSLLLVGSSRAQLKGSLLPERSPEGRLTALRIMLEARNLAIDAQGTVTSPVAVDQVRFTGKAAIEEARLDIEDLVVMSGNTGIRLRGAITGGSESPGILLAGRMKDLSAGLLKQLWPPVMAPRTRKWVNENVREGRIQEGEFTVNLPVDALAAAQRQRRLPENAIKLSFKMDGVTSGYFKDLPPLIGASGEASLTDNDFRLKVNGADVVMPSGGKGRLTSGTMVARDILGVETLAEFDLDVEGNAQPLIEYLDQPALNLIRHTGFDTSKLTADAKLNVKLSMPLIKSVPKNRIVVNVAAKLSKAALKDALPGIDITEGDIDLTVEKGVFRATGPVKLSGIPSKLAWERGPAPDFKQSAVIETVLDGEQRQTLGIDLGTFARGPVGVKAIIPDLGDPQGKVEVEADLSEVELRVQAISWFRPATAKTVAKLVYYSKGEKGPRVEDLEIKGKGLLVKGDLSLAPKRQGLRSARLSEVRLSDENRFAATIKVDDGGTTIAIAGATFDARPLIRSMFGSRNRGDAGEQAANQQPAKGKKGEKPVSVSLNLERLHANRGEIVTGVKGSLTARGGVLEKAEIEGSFLSGQPVVFRVTPVEGGREMRINGRDGGAAIRAANLYSKVAGGQIEFYALLGKDGSSVKDGRLVLRNFEVRNEAALAELDSRGKPKRAGPRREALTFDKLTLPFTSDARFIRIGESLVRGPELGASAEGLIRKSDGAVDITGTIIPAYALNAALGDIPLFGDILTGGRGQGIIGVTFALGGTVDKPGFQMNPVSAVAPGIFRRFFEYGNTGSGASPRKPKDN